MASCHYCLSSSAAKLYTAVLANSGLTKLHVILSKEDERSRLLKLQLLGALKQQVRCSVTEGSAHLFPLHKYVTRALHLLKRL